MAEKKGRTGIRQALNKLFGNEVIVRSTSGDQIKTVDVRQSQSVTQPFQHDKYRRMYQHGSPYSVMGASNSQYSFHTNRISLFQEYECLTGDTVIPLPGPEKSKTIEDLANEYPDESSSFYVFSYDHKNKKMTLGNAHSVRKTKTAQTYEITLDNGESIKATENHPVLMRDGNYKQVKNIKSGDSVMPFYRKDFYGDGYTCVYDFENGWKSTHRMVAESFDRTLKDGEVVHHKDFDKTNNVPGNLQIMEDSEHRAFHMRINNELIWSDENYERQCKAISEGLKNRGFSWNGKRRGKNNPFYGKEHTKESNNQRSNSLKEYHSSNPGTYSGSKNPNFRNDVTREVILKYAKAQYKNTGKLLKYKLLNELDCDHTTLFSRISEDNFQSFKTKVIASLNHKVVSVKKADVEDVYDMTVDVHHNFATDSFFVHNSMDEDPIISSALDIYANEAATKGAFGGIIDVECENGEIKDVLENLVYDILHVQDNARWWARSIAKYGDLFMKLEVYEDYGVVNVHPLSPYNVERYKDPDSGKTLFAYSEIGNSISRGKNESDAFQEWEIAHFRFTNDSNFFPYGKSIIENGRKIWQKLTLMEEAMLIHRIMRAPEKRVFKIDIGNIEPDAVDSYMKGIINDIQQTPLVDPQTGQYNLEFNMRNMLEDFFLPVRGRDTGTEINSLQGLQYQVIDDVEYLRKKLMSALKVPNAFLGYENEIQGKCIDPKTEIPLISGKTITAEKIIEQYDSEDPKPLYTYSYDEESGEMVAGEIEDAEMTRRDAEVVEVEIDNGRTITTTPDHKFMTRNGDWIEAQDLESGQSLMPLYLDLTNDPKMKGYTTVYHPELECYEPVHRVVERQFELKKQQKGSVIHHADFVKTNNRPDNLDCTMDFFEHREFHQKHCEKTLNSDSNIRDRINDPKWLESVREGGKKGGNANAEWLSNYASGREPANKNGSMVECSYCGESVYKSQSRIKNNNFCSSSCANAFNNNAPSKIEKISKEDVYQASENASSFKDIEDALDITRKTFNSLLNKHEIDKKEIITEYMSPSTQFLNAIQSKPKNHKVVSVKKVDRRIDTCDIQVKKYHNFAVSAGVIIHNSTLAQESIKFANAVRNLQESIAQELKKIAIVHLYTKGYEDEDLVGFSFKFTNPSIVAEQERIEFLSRKAGVANSLRDLPVHSDKWIAKNIFNMSEEEFEEQLREKVRDWKRNFRKDQIEREGNDPLKTGRSYGTPGDLASSGNNNIKNISLDDQDNESSQEEEQPSSEFDSVTAKDDDLYGLKNMSNLLRPSSSDISHNYQGGSPLALDSLNKNSNRASLIQESFKEEIEETVNNSMESKNSTLAHESIIEDFPDPDSILKEILDSEE